MGQINASKAPGSQSVQSLTEPSGHMKSKWRRIDVDATPLRRIDVSTTLFRRHVPAVKEKTGRNLRLVCISVFVFYAILNCPTSKNAANILHMT